MTKSRLNGILLTLVILCLQVLVNSYLLLNHQGEKRTGVFIFLLIGDVCLLLLLRYLVSWTCAELKTIRRACSISLWFLAVFITQIKTYFIVDAMKKDCANFKGQGSSCPLPDNSFERCDYIPMSSISVNNAVNSFGNSLNMKNDSSRLQNYTKNTVRSK